MTRHMFGVPRPFDPDEAVDRLFGGLYCDCTVPVVELIPLFGTAQCATCWRPFRPVDAA